MSSQSFQFEYVIIEEIRLFICIIFRHSVKNKNSLCVDHMCVSLSLSLPSMKTDFLGRYSLKVVGQF
jgi:hypothetical protein